MKLSVSNEQGFEILVLNGSLDIETVGEVKDDLQQVTQQAAKGVVLDMSGVTFMDSSGVGALVFMYKRLAAERKSMHLVGLKNQPFKLVKLLRIDQTISVHTHITDIDRLPQITVAQGS